MIFTWKLISFVIFFSIISLINSIPIEEDLEDEDRILDKETYKQFRDFQISFEKKCEHGTDECKSRKTNFARNLNRLNSLKKSRTNATFTLGLTSFMDATEEEMKMMVMDPKTLPRRQSVKKILEKKGIDDGHRSKRAATSFDWRTTGAVNPIRNQGSCGSCWAFASVAAIEIQTNHVNQRFNSNRRSFSEQWLMDCSRSDGCQGGWPYDAINYVMDNGLARLSAMSYLGYNKPCVYNVMKDMPVINWSDLTGDPIGMRNWVLNKGPITACFHVCSDFYYYTGDVYSSSCNYDSADYEGDHAVTIIGYGTTDAGIDYWIARNSWGTAWGIDGYFLMERGVDSASFESESVTGPVCTTTP